MLSCIISYVAVKKGGSLTNTINTLSIAYSISLLIGIMRYFGFTISFFENHRGGLAKNAFTFSEPSFISVHLYGFFAFFCFICWRYKLVSPASIRRALLVIIFYVFAASFQLRSMRFFIDSIGVIIISVYIAIQSDRFRLVLTKIKKLLMSKRFLISLMFSIFVALSISAYLGFDFSAIFRRFIRVQSGFDPSSELRYFRALTTWKSINSNFWILLFGGGFNNICIVTDGLPSADLFTHMMPFTEFTTLIHQIVSKLCVLLLSLWPRLALLD